MPQHGKLKNIDEARKKNVIGKIQMLQLQMVFFNIYNTEEVLLNSSNLLSHQKKFKQ
jgi:hypothetical protein